jgi:hypothetical protein
VHGSAKYQSLTTTQKTAVDTAIVALCEADLTPIKPGKPPAKKKALIALYSSASTPWRPMAGWTKAQATELSRFTSGL